MEKKTRYTIVYTILRKRITKLLLINISIVLISGFIYSKCYAIANVRLSEIQPYKGISYEGASYENYIEIYNPSLVSVSLEGLFLTDDVNEAHKYPMPDITVSPKGYALVEVDDNVMKVKSSGGQTFYLLSENGKEIDSIKTIKVPRGYSYSCVSSPNWELRTVTPERNNKQGMKYIPSPVLSKNTGFYVEPFYLQISNKEKNQNLVIYYTTDGSEPTRDSQRYTTPIYIYDRTNEDNIVNEILDEEYFYPSADYERTANMDKVFIIRAIAADGEGNISQETISTYFINKEKYKSLSVLSLVGNPDDFFGEKGIFVSGEEYKKLLLLEMNNESENSYSLTETEGVYEDVEPNYGRKGRETEIPVYIELLNGEKSFSQTAGMRIAGNSSRYSNRVKNLSIYARKEYSGSNMFEERIFGDIKTHKMGTRGGYANVLCQMLAKGRAVATQESVKTALFINGEYICQTSMIEKYDEKYFEEHFGIPKDKIVIFKEGEITGAASEGLSEIYDFLENNDIKNSDTFDTFCKLVDIQSYIDYMCIRIYIGDADFSENKNTVMWRSCDGCGVGYQDNRWRWALFDLDSLELIDAEYYGYDNIAEENTFCIIPYWDDSLDCLRNGIIFKKCRENDRFNERFVTTFMDIINENFSYEKVLDAMEEYGEIDESYQSANTELLTMEEYKQFFETRAEYIVPYMAEEFGLNGTLEELSINVNDVEGGTIQVNTIIPTFRNNKWTGKYYTDYPIQINAEAKEGFRFMGWTGDYESTQNRIEIELCLGGTKLYAIFEKCDVID